MPSKRRRTPPRRNATRRRTAPRQHLPRAEDQPLIVGFREAMRTPGGVAMLDAVGDLVEATRQDRPTLLQEVLQVALSDIVDSFIDIDIAETTAALYVLAAFVEDDLLRARMRRELAGRRQPMPEAVVGVAHLEVTRAWRLILPGGDVDDIVLGLSQRVPAALVAQVDRNAGIVSDAFAVPVPVHEVLDRFMAAAPEGVELEELSLADARARLEGPIDLGDIMIPPAEGDTWPAARPLLRMLCRRLPTGGTGYPMDAADADQKAIVRSVLATRVARRLDDTPGSEDADIVGTLVWLTGFLGFFEPLRWSPERAEAMLLDLVPRKVLADEAYLRRVPDVLTTLVLAAAELGHTPDAVADETIDAIEDITADYVDIIEGRPPGRGDEARRLALDVFAATPDVAAPRMAALDEMMGSAAAVAALDVDAVTALDERDLDVDNAPQSVREAAAAVDALAAGAIDALFAAHLRHEYRSAVRTLIERLAAATPDTLRRGKAANTAGALCWAVGRANDLLGEESRVDDVRHAMSVGPEAARRYPAPDTVPVKELFAHLGVSGNVTTRAATLLSGLGYEPTWVVNGTYALGDPTLLTSDTRRRVALARDRWAPARE